MIIANVENVVMERARKGWNQRQLALRTGLSAAAIAKLEAGEPISPVTVKKVMDAIGSPEVEKYFCYVSGKRKIVNE